MTDNDDDNHKESTTETNAVNDTTAANSYDWSAHYDDDGNLYYYNATTDESSWDPPPDGLFNPPEEEEREDEENDNVNDAPTVAATTTGASSEPQQQPSPDEEEESAAQAAVVEEGVAASTTKPKEDEEGRMEQDGNTTTEQKYDWSAHYDDEGTLYYYNATTDESSWDPPSEGFNPPEDREEEEVATSEAEAKTAGEEEEEPSQTSAARTDEASTAAATGGGSAEIAAAAAATTTTTGEAEVERETTPPPIDNAAATTNDDNDESSSQQVAKEEPAAAAAAAPKAGEEQKTDNDTTTTKEEQPQTEEEKQQTYDWSAYYDDEGRLYYFNAKTEESAWDPPEEGFNPPPPNEDEEEDATAVEAAAEPATTTAGKEEEDTPWVAYKDEEGREYYYNQETEETQWDKPEHYREEPEDDEEEAAQEQQQPDDSSVTKSPTAMAAEDVEMEEEAEDDDGAGGAASPEPETVIDPAVKRLQEAEEALNKPDSVLEPACMANVSEVVTANNGNASQAISALIENYHGQTAVCGLLAKWLLDLHQTNINKKKPDSAAASQKVLPDLAEAGADQADKIRDAAQAVINKMAKERFGKEAADEIMNLSKSEAAFLEEMMDSPRWRKLLIDLSAAHKDSAVLLYCLETISKRGHHREIAKRMNQSDHFAVFNAMLTSELAVIGSQAVSAGSDLAAATGFEELLHDLKRACTATSYTYLYSIEMLRKLEGMAWDELSKASDGENRERFRRAIRKWEALGETLESSMIDPSVSQSVGGSSALFRKRRLEVALTVSDLHQRQRRQKRKTDNGGSDPMDVDTGSNGHSKSSDLESALLLLLRRHSMGVQLQESVLDQLLPSGLDLDTRGVGSLLIRYPLAIRALLAHLYIPGATRVTNPSTKNKCARLIALAVLAAEQSAKSEATLLEAKADLPDSQEDPPPDEIALTRMILQGSQLCEQMETVISFLVTLEADKPGQDASTPGQKLTALALKCAPVGLGVVLWAREFTSGHEYAASASFPTLSPSILSLVRLVAMRHPFARPDALHIGLAFLKHSNPDISYQKVNSLKETSLRLLIFLLTKGDVVPVMSSIASRLKKSGSSEIDASLIRYFICGVLDVVKPPVSPVFLRMFGDLLSAPKAADALRSSYFSQANKKRLSVLLESFKQLRSFDGSDLSRRDTLLISTLLKMYQTDK